MFDLDLRAEARAPVDEERRRRACTARVGRSERGWFRAGVGFGAGEAWAREGVERGGGRAADADALLCGEPGDVGGRCAPYGGVFALVED